MEAAAERVNGYADWTTWNCALWLNNDERLYELALQHRRHGYAGLVEELQFFGHSKTPDGAVWAEADHEEMNKVLEEIQAE